MIVGWWRSCWLLAQMQIWRMYMKRTCRRGYSDREFLGPKLFPWENFQAGLPKKVTQQLKSRKTSSIPNLYFWVQNVNNCRVPARGTPCQRFAKSPRPKNTTPEVMETHLRAWKSNKFWRMLPRCSPYFRWKTNWHFFQGLENTPWNLQKSWVVISHSSSKPRISDLKKGSALLVLRGCHSRSCFKQVFRGVLRMVLGTALSFDA